MTQEETGSDGEETWEDVIALGVAANMAGRHDEAATTFTAAMVKASAFGAEDLRVSATLDHLAAALMPAGRHKEAEDALSRSIAIWEKNLGPHHPTYSFVAERLQILAEALTAQAKYDEAEAALRRAWDILQRTLGPRHSDLAPLLETYAVLLRKMGRNDDADAIDQQGGRLYFPMR